MTMFKSLSVDLDVPVLTESPSAETLLVGQILESGFPANSPKALVGWQSSDGQLYEGTLTVLKGLSVASGDLVLIQRPANWPEWIVTQVLESCNELNLPAVSELAVDGDRKQIEGLKEIVLRCGKASITLRSDGRVIIRGTYVETRASGTNRIKGGAVHIN
jgi:hypothetical protein